MSLLLICILVPVVGGLGGLFASLWLDAREGSLPMAEEASSSSSSNGFRLGRMPQPAQVYVVAALMGQRALRAAIHAAARAQGLLVRAADGSTTVVPDAKELDDTVEKFRQTLLAAGGTSEAHIDGALDQSAAALRPSLMGSADASALVRTGGAGLGAVVGAVIGVAFIGLAVGVRLPVALFGDFHMNALLIAAGVAAVVGAATAVVLSGSHSHAREYVNFLRLNSAAMQADAGRGVLKAHEEAIVAALKAPTTPIG